MKLVVLGVLLLPTLARADIQVAAASPPGSDLDTPPVQIANTQPIDVPIDVPVQAPSMGGIAHQSVAVAAEHGIVTSTALTVPVGHSELSVRAVAPYGALISIAGGVTSTTEIWADAGQTVAEYQLSTYAVGIKQVIVHGRNWQLAGTASFRTFADGNTGPSTRMAIVGGVATACPDDHCMVMASVAVSEAYVSDVDRTTTPVLTGGVSVGNTVARAILDAVKVDRASFVVLGFRVGNARFAMDFGVALVPDGSQSHTLPLISALARM